MLQMSYRYKNPRTLPWLAVKPVIDSRAAIMDAASCRRAVVIGLRRWPSEYTAKCHLYSEASSSGHLPTRQFVRANVFASFGIARYFAADRIIRRPVSLVIAIGSCRKTTAMGRQHP